MSELQAPTVRRAMNQLAERKRREATIFFGDKDCN
jgi:hypothetical protein